LPLFWLWFRLEGELLLVWDDVDEDGEDDVDGAGTNDTSTTTDPRAEQNFMPLEARLKTTRCRDESTHTHSGTSLSSRSTYCSESRSLPRSSTLKAVSRASCRTVGRCTALGLRGVSFPI
jgi:hypothetical protein